MSSSFDKIDYSLRPAKHTERRMLSEIFRRLWPFQTVSDYVYVGFGAVTFSDFVLFHRALGVKQMISIEQNTESVDRVRDNIPFDIAIDNRHSSLALRELEYKNRHIIWLDYDDKLLPSMLLDATTVASRACSGTVLAISFNCHNAAELAEAKSAEEDVSALDLFINRFGRDRVPTDVFEDDLHGWPYAKLGRSMFYSELQSALAVRNSGDSAEDVISFERICEIEYSDGAKMTTLIGVFCSESDSVDKLKACDFASLDFLPPDRNAIRIEVPKLTLREIRNLERQLPISSERLNLGTIPSKDAKRFAALYRYLPNFAVTES